MSKGILSGCILILLNQESLYGYTLNDALEKSGFKNISKGTIYPLLLNLEKKGFIKGERVPSPEGPSRKYYELTDDGREEMTQFIEEWQQLNMSVNTLLEKPNEV